MDFDEDPSEVIDGEVVPEGDEMDAPAEDKPGWSKCFMKTSETT